LEKALILQDGVFHVIDKMCDRLALSDECAPPVKRCAVLFINAHAEGCGLDKGFNELRTD
jgi:hypothetical protein